MKTQEKSQDNGAIKDFNTTEQRKAFENEKTMRIEIDKMKEEMKKMKEEAEEIREEAELAARVAKYAWIQGNLF